MKKITSLFVMFALAFLTTIKTEAQISVSITVGNPPPALPVYEQPACPTDGYLWVPGYWAYDNNSGYYWVPGVWVAPPNPGLLWTPAYWGYENGYYGFHAGYWGPHVGFYGGINYGYGYGGVGFIGGGWSGGHFRYNTAVVSVNTTVIHNTYVDRTVIHNTTVVNHTSFNGPGGVSAQPRPEERRAMSERHFQPTGEQVSHQQGASRDRNQFASVNGGKPAAASMNRVGGRPFTVQGRAATNSNLGHGFGANNRQNANQPQQNQQQHNQPQQNQQPHNQPQQRSQPHQQPHGGGFGHKRN